LEIDDACPLGNIKVKGDKKAAKVSIEIDEASCPCCRFCETKFPEGAVRVEKTFYGNLKINNEKCPEGCHDCADVCPITDVLYVQDGKVQVNDDHCVYCGACKIACPEEGALELNRTQVRHTEVRSGAWNRALEKLASRSAVVKETRTKSAEKLKKIVTNRLVPEELE
jgi:MinD superfamily P-loop ATPase